MERLEGVLKSLATGVVGDVHAFHSAVGRFKHSVENSQDAPLAAHAHALFGPITAAIVAFLRGEECIELGEICAMYGKEKDLAIGVWCAQAMARLGVTPTCFFQGQTELAVSVCSLLGFLCASFKALVLVHAKREREKPKNASLMVDAVFERMGGAISENLQEKTKLGTVQKLRALVERANPPGNLLLGHAGPIPCETLSASQVELMERLSDAYADDFQNRRHLIAKRLEVAIQACLYSDLLVSKKAREPMLADMNEASAKVHTMQVFFQVHAEKEKGDELGEKEGKEGDELGEGDQDETKRGKGKRTNVTTTTIPVGFKKGGSLSVSVVAKTGAKQSMAHVVAADRSLLDWSRRPTPVTLTGLVKRHLIGQVPDRGGRIKQQKTSNPVFVEREGAKHVPKAGPATEGVHDSRAWRKNKR